MVIEMDKKKWLWKRKASERSPGETDSSGSISSTLSERYSDEQEEVKESPNHSTKSPEVTSKVIVSDDEVTESVKNLRAKLSAALVNISIKEDIVRQHAKVAEEAVAGWEKAENEVAILKQQLEAAVQQNLALEVQVSHLDCALKECVRQLRQVKDEQEQKVHDAVAEKNIEWESVKDELENQLLQLQKNLQATIEQYPASVDPDVELKIDFLEKENSVLKFELLSRSQEFELRTIERDLSTQAAETASKQQLESIKKVARLEAECRRLQTIIRKSSTSSDNKSATSSIYAESVIDSQADSVDCINTLDATARKMRKLEPNEYERSRSDSWASALIAEFDQLKSEKVIPKGFLGSSPEIDMMDDFLEMERLAALPEPEKRNPNFESETTACKYSAEENKMKSELEDMINRVAELEERLEKIEEEKTKLERALSESQDSLRASQAQQSEAETRLKDLQKELCFLNEREELRKFQIMGMEEEARALKANVDSLEIKVQKERTLSAELAIKCQELENELTSKCQEIELQQTASANSDMKIKQEDIEVAADKLAECQKTIASLGRQLKSLATLEDFLIDTSGLPGFSGNKHLIPGSSAELKQHSNDVLLAFKYESDPARTPGSSSSLSANGNEGESPGSSSSTSSTGNVTCAKNRNGFARLFTRNKSGIQLEHHQG